MEIFQGTGRTITGAIRVFRGIDQTSVLDVSAVDDLGLTGYPDAPEITTVSADTLVVAVGLLDDDDDAANVVAPSGYGDEFHQGSIPRIRNLKETIIPAGKKKVILDAKERDLNAETDYGYRVLRFLKRFV